jgi:hypothetical protein
VSRGPYAVAYRRRADGEVSVFYGVRRRRDAVREARIHARRRAVAVAWVQDARGQRVFTAPTNVI